MMMNNDNFYYINEQKKLLIKLLHDITNINNPL